MDLTRLQPLPFLNRLLVYLKSEERDIWDWFSSGRVRGDQFEATRLNLLRSSIRIDRETQPAMYQLAEQAATTLQLTQPITLYQAQQSGDGLNAAIVWIPGEAHIILHGPLSSRLNERELLAMFGHELAHAMLWTMNDGEYHILGCVLNALANDQVAGPAHFRTQQLYSQYVEVYCDRASAVAVGELEAAVSALMKLHAGIETADPRSFLLQAQAVLAANSTPSPTIEHPEMMIRGRALQLWCEAAEDVEQQVETMLEGKLSLANLHFLRQVELAEKTRKLVTQALAPQWMRSAANLAHARMFFEDGHLPEFNSHTRFDEAHVANSATEQIAPDLRDYFCYVLLDLVTADPEIREPALAHVMLFAAKVGVEDQFLEIVRKELGLRKKQLESLRENAAKLVAQVTTEMSRP